MRTQITFQPTQQLLKHKIHTPKEQKYILQLTKPASVDKSKEIKHPLLRLNQRKEERDRTRQKKIKRQMFVHEQLTLLKQSSSESDVK